jgi:predicted RNA-binding protein with EMAP domain
MSKEKTANQQTVPAERLPEIVDRAGKLIEMLGRYHDLRDKLIEAIGTDHFFITVSCQLKRPGDPNDLQHFWSRVHYPVNDVLPSLKHIAGNFAAKEMPNAEIEGEGWH